MDRSTHPALKQAALTHELDALSRWTRERDYWKVSNGLWLSQDAPRNLETLSVAYSRLYPNAVLTGWSAAVLQGFEAPEGSRPELRIGKAGRERSGLILRRHAIPEQAVVAHRGLLVTAPRWTAFDLCRFLPLEDAVLALESFHHHGVRLEDFAKTVSFLAGFWGVSRAQKALALADSRSESPMETRTRLALIDGGIQGFRPQVWVPHLRYRLDLADEASKVAVEYDGGHHLSVAQQGRDLRRRNRLEANGWRVIGVNSRILRESREEFLEQVRIAQRRGRAS